ncbi:FAD:protein FMN transferase [Rhizobium sp. SEMIA 4085]|uniref:FAD:protein FMN transferase n=1 Tax=Rhizobium gallicum bv. gallicum R602sp TaxID=1041138 RepID=A0A0B4XI98_9HYPH|nr:FAD:protein FMN transferase [Rhizobium gallicum]AJD46157.1 ApbE family NosX accesory protein [Rhizobium gallicum bv. gallicum R602sp]NNH30389.1 FAD:protein FMN transferase [Rhizobium sp. SEMIA 4085]
MASLFTRRRAIAIFAAAAGLPLLRSADPAGAAVDAVVWRGQALGAQATLILHDDNRSHAATLIAQVVAEVERLETIFSLYRRDSALCELNRVGGLAAPPAEMIALLDACQTYWQTTKGLFDPTIQPLWELYAHHFSVPGADADGPPAAHLKASLGRIGFDAVRFNRDRIAFARPGMAISLNGVAQGFITDRVVDILRNAGVTSSLVNMGEDRAVGAQADGSPWRIGLASQEDSIRPAAVLEITNQAVATSSAAGFHFDVSGRFGHILDPRSGAAPQLYQRVSVVAKEAATADALSTAMSLAAPQQIPDMLAPYSEASVELVTMSGKHLRF